MFIFIGFISKYDEDVQWILSIELSIDYRKLVDGDAMRVIMKIFEYAITQSAQRMFVIL